MGSNEIYFPSYVWKNKLNYSHKEDLISSILKDYDENKNHDSEFNLEVTSSCMRSFYSEDLKTFSRMDLVENLLSLIYSEFEKYLKHFDIKSKFYCHRIWYSLYEYGMETKSHEHPLRDFSGAYYLKFDKEKDNSTFFVPYSPNSTSKYPLIEPKMQCDEVIFFPSYLLHGSKKHLNTDPRILISFDILCPDFSNNFEFKEYQKKEQKMIKSLQYQ